MCLCSCVGSLEEQLCPADTWRNNNVIITSFWRYNDVIIASCVSWVKDICETESW